jgi:hypothetical protein
MFWVTSEYYMIHYIENQADQGETASSLISGKRDLICLVAGSDYFKAAGLAYIPLNS